MEVKLRITFDSFSPEVRTITVEDPDGPDREGYTNIDVARMRAIQKLADELEANVHDRKPWPLRKLTVEFLTD